jgi:hypothetical protein
VKKAILTVVLCVAVVAGGIAAVFYAGGGSGDDVSTASTTTTTLNEAQKAEQVESTTWDTEATNAFGGQKLSTAVSELLKTIEDWKGGARPTDQVAGILGQDRQTFLDARDRIKKLRPYPRDPQVNTFYLRSAEMYVDTVRLYQAMLTLPAGPLRDQQELEAKRVRELADRVFDRGRASVVPHLFEPKLENVEVNLPEEVPKWAAEGVLPGPPLDDAAPPADKFPPTHEATRPTQERAKWIDAVKATAIPSAGDLAAAITNANADQLKGHARAYVKAAEQLRPVPDPDGPGGREESARVRLGLLVDGEAARTAQLATLLPDAAQRPILLAIARRLALVGDELWSPDLPARSTGFDPAVFDASTP